MGALGVLVAVLVAAGLWYSWSTLDRNRRLDEAPERIALELGRAHFAVDEVLAREPDVDPRSDVVDRVHAALASCRRGARTAFEAESREAFVELCEDVEALRNELVDGVEVAARPGVSEEALERLEDDLDAGFDRVLARAQRTDLVVEAAIDGSDAGVVRLQVVDLVLVVALVVGIVLVVRRGRRGEEERAAELRAQAVRLEEAQRLANVGSYELDPATGESVWSPELYRIHGVDPETFVPTFESVGELVHPDDQEEGTEDIEAAILAGETWDYEYRIVRPDGEVRWIHARGRGEPAGSGEPVRVVGTFQDVTEQRRAMEVVQRGLEQQRAAADRLRALDEMKDALLTAVSHHVRTPLTSIIGFSSILAEHDLDADRRRDLARRMLDKAEELEELLGELIDVDRLGREFTEVQRVRIDVAALVREEVEGFRGDRPVEVAAEPVEAEVDPDALRRILGHLLANADRFSPPGAPVEVGVEAVQGGGVLVRVDDRGPGVPEGLREAIFEPFRQGPGVRSHDPGLGMGLAVVSRLARLHGGRAWVEDREGEGASFRVLLRPEGGEEPEAPERVRRLLEVGRRHLDMDLAFVSRMTADRELFLYVEGDEAFPGIEGGGSLPVEETYCRHMLAGDIPHAVPDAGAVPEVRQLRITREAGVGAYVGVPVVLGDGTVYGALCCVSKAPAQGVGEQEVAFLRMLGELVALELDPGHRSP